MNKQFISITGIVLVVVIVMFSGGEALADNRVAACYSKPRGTVIIINKDLNPSDNLGTRTLINLCKNAKGTLIILAKEGVAGPQGPVGPQGPPGPPGPAPTAVIGEPDCFLPTVGDNLVGCDLTQASVIFPGNLDLRGINATGAKLDNLTLAGGYDFSGADFTTASLVETIFSVVGIKPDNFSFANFRGANLTNSNLSGVNLSFTDFSNADLCGVNFSQDCPDGVNTCAIVGNGITMSAQTICPNGSLLGVSAAICAGRQLTPSSTCLAIAQ
jgi:hypothetical protein